MLTFSEQARGRVGAFAVGKKPKEVQGRLVERQRLILDCRRTNLMFRAPPVTELGSLPALGDLQIPSGENLYISGGGYPRLLLCLPTTRISQRIFLLPRGYMPEGCPRVFPECVPEDIAGLPEDFRICPGLDVLPMGFTWRFYLVQGYRCRNILPNIGGGGGVVDGVGGTVRPSHERA